MTISAMAVASQGLAFGPFLRAVQGLADAALPPLVPTVGYDAHIKHITLLASEGAVYIAAGADALLIATIEGERIATP